MISPPLVLRAKFRPAVLGLVLAATAPACALQSAGIPPSPGALAPDDGAVAVVMEAGRPRPPKPATTATEPTTAPAAVSPPSVSTTAPVPAASFRAVLDPTTGIDGWQPQVSDPRESLVVANGRVEATVGGFAAPTHYARVRRPLPETDDVAPRGGFSFTAVVEIPAGFYESNESYVRFVTTDNFPGTMRSTGVRVGAASEDEWRVGFLVYGSDGLPRLESSHEGRSTITLWTGTQRLPVGVNTVTVSFTPSQSAAGGFSVTVNGAQVGAGTGVQTVPPTLQASEVVVTRVGAGLDGAADQSTRRMSVFVHRLEFAAAP